MSQTRVFIEDDDGNRRELLGVQSVEFKMEPPRALRDLFGLMGRGFSREQATKVIAVKQRYDDVRRSGQCRNG